MGHVVAANDAAEIANIRIKERTVFIFEDLKFEKLKNFEHERTINVVSTLEFPVSRDKVIKYILTIIRCIHMKAIHIRVERFYIQIRL